MLRALSLTASALLLPHTHAASIALNATTIPHLGWVQATFTLDAPGTADVFFTVHTPATANVSRIAAQPYPAEAPWLAAAAQKWVSCAAVPGCLGGRAFSFNFSLVNSYASAILHAFAGGPAAPQHLAASPAIAFSSPTAPSRGHLARLPDPSVMNVTWWSPLLGVAGAQVRWGASPDALQLSAPAWAATYTPADLCGLPATGMGWQEAHYWLTATISGLAPGSAAPVFYSYGSEAGGWSAPLSFLPAPAPGPAQTTKMLLLADNGVTEPDGCQDHWDEPDASLTVQHLRELIQSGSGYDYSLILHPGDVSYATGMLAKWPTFTARWAGVFDRVPYMVGQGNHERDFPNSAMGPSPFASSMDSGGECGVVTDTIFPGSVQWRALAHGAVTVLMLNSELSVAEHSPQYNWTRDALSAVNRALTPWVVVAFHRPLYFVSKSAAPGGAAGKRDADFAPLEPLLVAAGVDAVLVGHVHNALVTCPVSNSVCGKGPVHVCIGNAGQGITDIQTTNVPEWVLFQKAAFGYSTLEANATHMSISLFGDSDEDNSLWYTANFTK